MAKSVEEILSEIRAFHGDVSLTPSETKEGLEEILEEVETLLDTMDDVETSKFGEHFSDEDDDSSSSKED